MESVNDIQEEQKFITEDDKYGVFNYTDNISLKY